MKKTMSRKRNDRQVGLAGKLELFSLKGDLIEIAVCVGVIALTVALSASAIAAQVLSSATGISHGGSVEWLMTLRTAAIWFLVPNILVIAGRQNMVMMAGAWALVHVLPVYGIIHGHSIVDLLIQNFFWTGVNIMMLPVFYFLSFLRSKSFALVSTGWRYW